MRPVSFRAAIRWAGASVILALLASCSADGGTGFVEIKTFPALPQTTFYMDTVKLEPIKNGSAVLRQNVGTRKLQSDIGGGHLVALCELVVRKDRITSVTVSMFERPPRCQCKNPGGSAPSSNRVCI